MAGTPAGGRKAAITNKAKYDHVSGPLGFYGTIGSKGGKVGNHATKGFGHPDRRHLASEAGKKGGAISRYPEKETPSNE